ncbi:hypothetical protein [Thiohalorhabdus sp.]|uniref:hypothetical protein n=1 Tax=Thiohalorhabdus sp. TaxID=3094134 RepID=UPI002FC3AC0F
MGDGRHATVAAGAEGAFVAWAAPRESGNRRIVVAPVVRDDDQGLVTGAAERVETDPPQAPQLYPALAVTAEGLVVAWEDRREGHTRIFHAFAPDGAAFTPARAVSEDAGKSGARYGKGSGVTRVVLSRLDGSNVGAAWMDKRHYKSGYDIYAAFSTDGGRHFGPNQPVFDMVGQADPDWHPAIAGGAKAPVAVAWDDARDGNDDVWLSWRTGPKAWSNDLALPGAGGPGHQSHPALAVDARGDLHAAYLAQDEENGPTRLYYVHGERR